MAKHKPQTQPPPSPHVVPVIVPRCKKCQSSRRTDYHNVRTMEYHGTLDGVPYTTITWRRTTCLDCGQARTDKFYA